MPTHRYRKDRQLGHGGGGTVYRGRTRFALGAHERDCAVKLVYDSQVGDPAVVARFADEAILGYELARHPHLVVTRTCGFAPDGQPYAVMDLEGPTLEDVFGAVCGDFDIARAIAAAIVSGLDALARIGWIHGDVNRGNVFFGRDGAVKLGDFGKARRATDADRLDPYDDRWRLGRMLYELATGEYAPGRRAPVPDVPDSVPPLLRRLIAGLFAPLEDRLALAETAALIAGFGRGGEPLASPERIRELAHLPDREGWDGWQAWDDDDDDDDDDDASVIVELGGDACVGAGGGEGRRSGWAAPVIRADRSRPRSRRAIYPLAPLAAGALGALAVVSVMSRGEPRDEALAPSVVTSTPAEPGPVERAPRTRPVDTPEPIEPAQPVDRYDAAVAPARDESSEPPARDLDVTADVSPPPRETARPSERTSGVRKLARSRDGELVTPTARREREKEAAMLLVSDRDFALVGSARAGGIAVVVESGLWMDGGTALVKLRLRNASRTRFRAGEFHVSDDRGWTTHADVASSRSTAADVASPVIGVGEEAVIALRIHGADRLVGKPFSLEVRDPEGGRVVTVRDIQWRQ